MIDSTNRFISSIRFSGSLSVVGLLLIAISLSACGNRGALYLKKSDEEQAQPGHELTQDSEKKDKRK